MDHLQTRLDALEQQVQTLNQQTHTVKRQLRWWRGLAGGLLVLAGLTWALPAVIAQEEATEKGQKKLAQRVEALEDLLKHFSREGNEIFITGANLHIVNGLGSTGCGTEEEPIPDCPNGLGNLIVGYNESRGVTIPGFEDNRTGSHNVVVGQRQNFSRFGGLVVGDFNTISGDFAAVSGGFENTASGHTASVSGGFSNVASGGTAVVSGGTDNTASGLDAMVSGGAQNTASGDFAAVVSGGFGNSADSFQSVVSGGEGNFASGERAVVSGGFRNIASGQIATVSGGQGITQETMFGWSAGSEADEVVVGNFRSP
jgi:hypothetical protein